MMPFTTNRVLALLLDLELPMKTDNALKEKYNVCEAVRQMRESSKEEGRLEGRRGCSFFEYIYRKEGCL